MGGWVFDDPAVNLVKEPFVAGADDLLSILSEGATQLTVIFASIPFPDYQLKIDKLTEAELAEIGRGKGKEPYLVDFGTYYQQKDLNHLLWLCPALNKYIPVSPDQIYIKVIKVK